MKTVKERASQALQLLPNDCTWDDVLYEIVLRQQVEEGLQAADEGRVVPHEEAKKRVSEMLASYGLSPH